MTRRPASDSALLSTGRVLVTALLTALALSGCGSDEPSGAGSQGGPPADAGTRTSTSPSAEQAAFAAMLAEVAAQCPSTGAAPSAPDTGNASAPRRTRPTTGPDGEQSLPAGPGGERSLPAGETPPTDAIEPGAPTGPDTELNDRDWCASVQHEQRIIQALQAVPEPTPAKVRTTLNGLGYIDERIHGLRQDGEVTRFHLDLRESGGRLCETGLAAGEQTDVTACMAPAAGAFIVTDPGSPG
ncbi:hypothetical protein [Streptomyces aureus]|uniref:hypothetical protein n=1 Tax=Streptomyces aureus TaxID=193461 RepID=UPI0033F26F47